MDVVENIFERIEVISDIDVLIENGELDYFFNKPNLEKEKMYPEYLVAPILEKKIEGIVTAPANAQPQPGTANCR